jgi:hypothetical protein
VVRVWPNWAPLHFMMFLFSQLVSLLFPLALSASASQFQKPTIECILYGITCLDVKAWKYLGFFAFVFCCPFPHTIFLLIFHPKRQNLPSKWISHLHFLILTSLSIGMILGKNDLKKKISHRRRVGLSTFLHIWVSKSISNCAQYVTLDSKIICLSLAVFFWQPHQLN